MSTVRIGFSKHRGFAPLSWAIMAVERTPFSHAYLKFYSVKMDRWLVYEATGKGVFFKSLAVFDEEAETIEEYELPMTDEQRNAIMTFAIDQSGRPYSRTQIVGMLLRRLGQRFGVYIRNPFRNGQLAWVCNELAARAIHTAGYPELMDVESSGLPELVDLVRDLGLKRI